MTVTMKVIVVEYTGPLLRSHSYARATIVRTAESASTISTIHTAQAVRHDASDIFLAAFDAYIRFSRALNYIRILSVTTDLSRMYKMIPGPRPCVVRDVGTATPH